MYVPDTKLSYMTYRLAIYVDDVTSKNVAIVAPFEQRFLRGLPQLDPVLTAFAEVIISLCDHYDTLVANVILTAILDFVNSSCMEPTIERLPLIQDAGRFPWYLRDQTGIGKGFALFMFTKSSKIVITDFIQAIPDLNYWISAVNDFLSCVSINLHICKRISLISFFFFSTFRFHKEELGGEEANYIHNRAYMEGKTAMQVLGDMGRELLDVRASILAVLAKSPRSIEIWQNWERGYMFV